MRSIDEAGKLSLDERVARLARAADILAGAIEGQTPATLTRRPDAKNWAPTEVICHLRDTEENFLARFEAVIAMDEPRFLGLDPDRWAEERQYLRNDAGQALAAFRRRREESLAFLRGLDPTAWRRGGVHATRGRMTVEDFVNLMVWHDENHLQQLRRALRGEA